MLSCTTFINRTITEEVSWFQGGNHQDWRGSKFPLSFVHEFFSTMNIHPANHHVQIWLFWVHLPYLGDYVHFLGINAHNSSSNNWCMKGCTRTAWKTMLVPFSKFSCLLQGMDKYFDGMCGNSQPQMSVCWVFNYKKWNKCLKNMMPGMVPWYDLTMPW